MNSLFLLNFFIVFIAFLQISFQQSAPLQQIAPVQAPSASSKEHTIPGSLPSQTPAAAPIASSPQMPQPIPVARVGTRELEEDYENAYGSYDNGDQYGDPNPYTDPSQGMGEYRK